MSTDQPQHSTNQTESSTEPMTRVRVDLVYGEGEMRRPMREDADFARLVRDGLGRP